MGTGSWLGIGRRLALLVLLAGLSAVACTAIYQVSVRTVRGRVLSDTSLRGALQTGSALADTVDAVLNVVSVASLLGAVALVAVVALVRLERTLGLVGVAVLVGANSSTWLLKNHLLSRPDLGLPEVAPATLNSLPSGHSTAAFSAVAALLVVLPRRWRLPAAMAGAAYATVTALATMSAGWHRAGDSVAAFLVVVVWAVLGATALLLLGAPRPAPEVPPPTAVRWPLACGTGVGLLGATLALALVAADPLQRTGAGPWLAFGAGALLIAGTSLVAVVVVLLAMDLVERRPAAVQET